MDNDKEKKACTCGCDGKGKKTPWGSIVIIALCACWIIGRLIYFYTCDGCCAGGNAECGSDALTTTPGNVPAAPSDVAINGILASDLAVLRSGNVADIAFTNAFRRLSERRRELAAQQTAVEFDYKNWLNSWATTNFHTKVKISKFRGLAKKDQSDPKVAAEVARLSSELRQIVGADPVGAALLARCEALLPETEAVEALYAKCVKAMAAAGGASAPASAAENGGGANAPKEKADISALKPGPASEPVSFTAQAAVSTNSTSDAKAPESPSPETKELKE